MVFYFNPSFLKLIRNIWKLTPNVYISLLLHIRARMIYLPINVKFWILIGALSGDSNRSEKVRV